MLLAGKSRIIYLLSGAHLGGIGHQQATLGPACDQDIDVTAAFPPGDHDVLPHIDDITPGGSWGVAVALYWYF